MAKKADAEVASLNPKDFLQGGLKTDFRGVIREAVYCPWDYNGTIKDPVLGVRFTIEIEGEDKPYVDYWSAGDLSQFVPSEDGKTAAEDEEGGVGVGPYALKVGKRPQLNNNTNFAHLMGTIIEAGEASKKFRESDLTSSLECLVGLDAHWDRVPQKKRSGMVEREAPEGGEKRQSGGKDVLVVTSVYAYGEDAPKKGKNAVAVKAKPKAEPAEDSDDDPVDSKLTEILLEALSDGDQKRGKLAQLVLKAAAGEKNKAALVKRVTEDDFLESGPWTYDADAGTLSLG